MLGYSLQELSPTTYISWADLTHPDDSARCDQILQSHLAGESAFYESEYRMKHKDGHWVWILDRGQIAQWDENGQPVAMAGTHMDITERKRSEEKLQLAASVFSGANEGIMITDAQGSILDVNQAFSQITGFSKEEVLGLNPRFQSSGIQTPAFYAAMWKDLTELKHWKGEIWNKRKNGEIYAQLLTISAVNNAQGETNHFVALFSDITPIKQHEKQLEHIAHYDALTGLPNRILLSDRLHQAMNQARRRKQWLAVVYIDLDGFKTINDGHGHITGDQLLISVANRMKHALRDGDTIARLGGDEFAAVIIDFSETSNSVPMLRRLLQACSQPMKFGDTEVQVTASLGVSYYPQDDDIDADQLLRQADHAMYQAKLAGKNRYHIFDPEHDRSVRGHHENLKAIRNALIQEQFVLYYQPKVNMRSGKLQGVEALIRWQHPVRGLLPPIEFLPIIEDHPIAIELGEWVLEKALTQHEIWKAKGQDIPVSINVDAYQLQQKNFMQRIHQIIERHPDIAPDTLVLEVLETSALEDITHVSQVMEACQEIGVMFALDDFGTGYSSLTYLKSLPANQLKIDQSFVHDMLDDPEDLAILEGVIGLARAFRREAIAEGVEAIEQGEMLLQMGCEYAQGYFIARPMPAEAIPDWLEQWHPPESWANQHPVQRDTLPVLFAAVEHRAWIKDVQDYIHGDRFSPPAMDPKHCRFGVWFHQAKQQYTNQLVIESVEQAHLAVHSIAKNIIMLKQTGRLPEAKDRLPELLQVREELLAALKALHEETPSK